MWNPEVGVFYNITDIYPNEVTVTESDRNATKVTLLYNVQYNVSISATLCGLKQVTSMEQLHYGESDTSVMIQYHIVHMH